MAWEATSPYGPLPVASWECHSCRAGAGESYTSPGDSGRIRDHAVEHIRATGHTVTVRRGTAETIEGLNLRPPAERITP